jgi:hypothetical protein
MSSSFGYSIRPGQRISYWRPRYVTKIIPFEAGKPLQFWDLAKKTRQELAKVFAGLQNELSFV